MSTLYYLPLRHDALAKYILKAIIANKESSLRYKNSGLYFFLCLIKFVRLIHDSN